MSEDKKVLNNEELDKVNGGVDIPESVKTGCEFAPPLQPKEIEEICYPKMFHGAKSDPGDPSSIEIKGGSVKN